MMTEMGMTILKTHSSLMLQSGRIPTLMVSETTRITMMTGTAGLIS